MARRGKTLSQRHERENVAHFHPSTSTFVHILFHDLGHTIEELAISERDRIHLICVVMVSLFIANE